MITIELNNAEDLAGVAVKYNGKSLSGISQITLDANGRYAEVYVINNDSGEKTARILDSYGFIVHRIDPIDILGGR